MKILINLCLCFLISIPFSFGQNQVIVNGSVSNNNGDPVNESLITISGFSACADSIYTQTSTDQAGFFTAEFVADCPSGSLYVEALCSNGNIAYFQTTWESDSIGVYVNIVLDCDISADCINYNQIDTTAACTTEYSPVCGCNGVTYGNSCEAELWGGVSSWTPGACQVDSTGCNGLDLYITSTPNNNAGYVLTASVSGGTPPYTYVWDTGLTTSISTVYEPGTYCITVIDSEGCTVTSCEYVEGNNTIDSCSVWIYFEGTSNPGDAYLLEASAFGTAPYIYSWSTGETTESIVATVDGTYCVDMIDAIGCASYYCVDLYQDSTWNGGDECYDWTVINFEADCPEVYDPVCGCDNVTYDNACFAEYCFGIVEWTAGPCSNTGDNDNPSDSLALCSASFDYTIAASDTNSVTITFIADATGVAPFTYAWTVENDQILLTSTFSYDVILQDSFTILPVCLDITDSEGCISSVCETIIIDTDPNGNIDGTITESDGLVGDNEIYKKSGNGDPLPNTTVTLLNVSGALLETTQTNEGGFYRFDGLYFGDYFVQVVIDGIEHEPYHVKLNPVVQTISNTDFEVGKTSVETTATQELVSISDVTVFPNPVLDQLNVRFNGLTSETVQLVIYNVSGQRLYQESKSTTIGTQQWTVPVSTLSNGIYMMSIQSENGVTSQRFVK